RLSSGGCIPLEPKDGLDLGPTSFSTSRCVACGQVCQCGGPHRDLQFPSPPLGTATTTGALPQNIPRDPPGSEWSIYTISMGETIRRGEGPDAAFDALLPSLVPPLCGKARRAFPSSHSGSPSPWSGLAQGRTSTTRTSMS